MSKHLVKSEAISVSLSVVLAMKSLLHFAKHTFHYLREPRNFKKQGRVIMSLNSSSVPTVLNPTCLHHMTADEEIPSASR